VERRCRVIEGEEHRALMLVTLCLCVRTPVHLGDLRAGRKDSKGMPSEGGDDPRLERRQLPCKEWRTCGNLRALGVAVLWGSTLHRIQDEDLLAPEVDGGQKVI
jgi:hypothetical protein